MTTCHGCKKTIWFLRFEKSEKAGHTTDRAGNIQEMQYKPVVKCLGCHLKEIMVKAVNDMARRAVVPLKSALALCVILGALAVSWFFIENTNAPSQTVAVTAVAPKATAPTLIPPGDRGAR
jgi:hypothetical protein